MSFLDYVCSKECEAAHNKEMDYFCGTVLGTKF